MKALKVMVDGGYLYATVSGDPDYPGICVEFVPNKENADAVSNPAVLVEKPKGGELRVLVLGDEDNEDYTTEIKFN